MKKILLTALLCILLLPVSHATAAPEKGSIILTAINEVEVEVLNEEGEKIIKRVDAADAIVVPGDIVIYTIRYENISDKPVENVIISDPIPTATVYLFGSAEGADTDITFSVNGGESYDVPENLFVKDAEGKKVPAKPSDYTHIRWILQKAIAPGAKGDVTFKTIIK